MQSVSNPEPENNKRPTIVLQTREVMTQAQVMPILHMVQALVSCLNGPAFMTDETTRKDLDGGVKSAMESTIIRACGRLDAILGEDSRWTISESPVEKYLSTQSALAEAQMKLTQHAMKPHQRHKPALIKMSDGNWCAMLGDVDDLDNAITGIGRTPQEALDAFDGMFTGQIPPALLDFLNAIKTKLENEPNLDREGNSNTDGAEETGQNQKPDSEGFGPDEDSGGTEAGPDGLPGGKHG
jgi:hypothetical protein